MTAFSNSICTDQKSPTQKIILQLQFREDTQRKYIGHTPKNIEKYFCLLKYVETAKTCMVSKKSRKICIINQLSNLAVAKFFLKKTNWSGKVQDSKIVQLTISQLKDLKYAVTLSIISFSMSFFLQAFLPVAVMKETQLYFDLQLVKERKIRNHNHATFLYAVVTII